MFSFQPFADTADAVTAATTSMEAKVSKSLKSFLKKALKKNKKDSELAILDKNLGVSLKDSFKGDLQIASDTKTHELFRGIRMHLHELLEEHSSEVKASDLKAMQLGLSHSLSRYKLKFSADKVDTMIIQAIGLLDELDKEINTYAMRTKEWYGWHFPELQRLVNDNAQYAKLVLRCGMRPNFKDSELSDVLEEEHVEKAVKDAAEISMGTEISEMDIINIKSLAEQVLSMTEYRAQLWEYLKNRMNAIAPNLSILVGELVGARLIAHAGSLLNLAKQPASTVQILGAEKALFRALKTKHDTPKYGLIYHASLVGQAQPKHKGKISRVLAAKASLATRVDALSEDLAENGGEVDTTIGYEGRSKVEARLRSFQGGADVVSGSSKNKNGALTNPKTQKYDPEQVKASKGSTAYDTSMDIVMDDKDKDEEAFETPDKKKKKDKKKKDKKDKSSKKRKADDIEEETGENKSEEESEEKKSAKKSAKKKSKKARKSKD